MKANREDPATGYWHVPVRDRDTDERSYLDVFAEGKREAIGMIAELGHGLDLAWDKTRPIEWVGVSQEVTQPEVKVPTQCACGCGGTPSGRKSRYLPGHDSKHRHNLAMVVKLAPRQGLQEEE